MYNVCNHNLLYINEHNTSKVVFYLSFTLFNFKEKYHENN